MRILIFILILAGSFFGSGSIAYTCECNERPPTAWVELNQTGRVFIGKVIEVTRLRTVFPDSFTSEVEVRLSVAKTLKGEESKTVVLRARSYGCGGIDFKKGQDYLVFAYRTKTGGWGAGGCSRTGLLKESKGDLWEIEQKKEAIEINDDNKPLSLEGRNITLQ